MVKNCNFSKNWEMKIVAEILNQPVQENAKNLEQFLGMSQIHFNQHKTKKISILKQFKNMYL